MSSSCLSCSDPIAPCACSAGQQCVQTGRSCNACAKNVCIDDGSSKSSGGGGGSSTGATAGGAVGGVIGVAVILVALYFFWWKPRGLAASQRRYSKHLSHRQSRLQEKRKTQLNAAAGAGGADANGVSKRSSVHLHVGEPGQEAVNRRNTSPGAGAGRSEAATGALANRTSEEDNPFGDQNRSSIGTFDDAASLRTSEFSFRSSHSTNVIPIAYIPPHSSSLSVADGQRGAFGEVGGTSSAPPPRSAAVRASIPTSMASRDSLALAGAEIIELNPLPPVLTPDTPAVPHGTTANGAPIRPPRSPGLDLQLPKTSSPLTSPLTSPNAQRNSTSRPLSGFPFTAAPSSSSSPAFLSPSPSPNTNASGRGMSVLGEPRAAPGHMSTFTTRSGTSTMSYILDPPQIITPFNSNGVRRVELQKGQAAVVQLGASGNPSTPTTATEVLQSPSSENPFDDSAAESSRRHSRMDSQETVKNGADSRPTSTATDTSRWTRSSLASEGAESVQFLQGQTVTFTNPNTPLPASPNHASLPSSSRLANTASIASAFDGPQSARSSEAFDTGSHVRPLLAGGSGGAPLMSLNMSRSSTASGTSDVSSSSEHMSLLEGIPFMAPPVPGAGTSSVSLGLPVNVTATLDGTPASVSAPMFPSSSQSSGAPSLTTTSTIPPPPPPPPAAPSATPAPSAPIDLFAPDAGEEEDDDPLPAPFLPFAGQRPTSSAPGAAPAGANKQDRVQSEAFSVRSGFGSGLSQIPFQLGFPSGFGDDGASEMGDGASDRGSMISTGTRDSRFTPARASSYDESTEGEDRRDSVASDLGAVVVQEAVRTPVGGSPLKTQAVVTSPAASVPLPLPSAPPALTSTPTPSAPPPAPAPSAPPTHTKQEEEAENPFADPRASVDSFALAAALSANLDAAAEGK
ncbi:hypothetical protein JCM6882_006765 [Rhodosporidiobolus microsporus]